MRPRHGSAQENLSAANAERVYEVTRAENAMMQLVSERRAREVVA